MGGAPDLGPARGGGAMNHDSTPPLPRPPSGPLLPRPHKPGLRSAAVERAAWLFRGENGRRRGEGPPPACFFFKRLTPPLPAQQHTSIPPPPPFPAFPVHLRHRRLHLLRVLRRHAAPLQRRPPPRRRRALAPRPRPGVGRRRLPVCVDAHARPLLRAARRAGRGRGGRVPRHVVCAVQILRAPRHGGRLHPGHAGHGGGAGAGYV